MFPSLPTVVSQRNIWRLSRKGRNWFTALLGDDCLLYMYYRKFSENFLLALFVFFLFFSGFPINKDDYYAHLDFWVELEFLWTATFIVNYWIFLGSLALSWNYFLLILAEGFPGFWIVSFIVDVKGLITIFFCIYGFCFGVFRLSFKVSL